MADNIGGLHAKMANAEKANAVNLQIIENHVLKPVGTALRSMSAKLTKQKGYVVRTTNYVI